MPASLYRDVVPAPAVDVACAGAGVRREVLPVTAGHLTVGISGARRNAAVAACRGGILTSFCEQERVTRVRGARLEPGMLPAEALSAVLQHVGACSAADVRTFVVGEDDARVPDDLPSERVEHHRAHAASAFHASPFDKAAVLVCDQHSTPPLTVWLGDGHNLLREPWAGQGSGFATLYSECSQVFGFRPGQEHQIEALARLDAQGESDRLEHVIGYRDGALWASPGWKALLCDWLSAGNGSDPLYHRAHVAGVFQRHLGRVLLALLADVRAMVGTRRLCLAGGLFYNTYFTTLVRQSGIFDDVFVPPNPGNAGVAAGAALDVARRDGLQSAASVSAFLGPGFDLEAIKRTLDNCKLSYECLGEDDVIAVTVEALKRGRLVGWFQGRMEWGHRALGNRSILASPLSPYVLDNLNTYLKHRARYRTYGLSVPRDHLQALFAGPPASGFMQYEYEIREREQFCHVLPRGARTLRVQTVEASDAASCRYGRLHEAFGEATGVPVLVNTSFNGFSEPIVCSPRDALRVFFGTGLDMLVLDRFVLRK
jgi:carbamoyltransferase